MHHRKIMITTEIILAVMFLICGCAIYLFYRSKSLYIYQWCQLFGISDMIDSCRHYARGYQMSEFIKYSLPDGLYCAAYILLVDAIWYDDNRIVKFLILSVVPIATVGSELLQYFRIVRGTFDIRDLISYAIPSIVYYGIYQSNHNLKTENL